MVHTLPEDVLATVFSFADNPISNRHTLIHLTHVCSWWRQVALTHSTLWSTITLFHPLSKSCIIRTRLFLQRSAQAPLTIRLDFRDPNWDWGRSYDTGGKSRSHRVGWQESELVLQLFLEHVSRWKEMVILTDTWSPIFTFLWYMEGAGVQSEPKQLERLELVRCNAYFARPNQRFAPENLKSPKSLFGQWPLPSLRHVALSATHIVWSPPPFTNLVSLEIKAMASDVQPTLDEFRQMIHASPTLQTFAIAGSVASLDIADGSLLEKMSREDPILFPSLVRFSLEVSSVTYATALLSTFHFTKLETLHLEDIRPLLFDGQAISLDSIDPVLYCLSNNPRQFSFACVRSLGLSNIHSTPSAASRFFSTLPALHTLSIKGGSSGCIGTLRDPAICSSLQRVECGQVDPEAMLPMAKARPGTKIALNVIRADTGPPLGKSMAADLLCAGVEVVERVLSVADSMYMETDD